MVRQAKSDVTIRTALLEARYVWGDQRAVRRGGAALQDRGRRPAPRAPSSPTSSPSATRATSKMGDTPLCRRTQRQGGQGRPARSPHAVLDRQIRLRRPARRRTGRGRAVHHGRIPPVPPRREFPLGGALPPAQHHRPRRGPADLRPAARDRRADALSPTGPGKSTVERFMQYLFPAGEDRRRPDRRVPRASRREVRRARAALRAADASAGAPRKLNGFVLDRGRLALPRDDFFQDDPVRLIEMFALADKHGARDPPAGDARRRARCEADRRRSARDPTRQRAVPRRADLPARSRDGAALDERGGRVRPLRARFRPRRRADAVRHVPSLHRRRAHDPRDRPAGADRAAAS